MASACSLSPPFKRSLEDNEEIFSDPEDSFYKRLRKSSSCTSHQFDSGMVSFNCSRGLPSRDNSSASSSSSSMGGFSGKYGPGKFRSALDDENESPPKRNQCFGSISSNSSGCCLGTNISSKGQYIFDGQNAGAFSSAKDHEKDVFIFSRERPGGDKRLRNCGGIGSKDSQKGDSNGDMATLKAPLNPSHMQAMYEMQLLSNNKDMARKNIEICGLNSRVNTLGEENKILKRAVAIQESRQRELQSNNQQLELTLQQAVQHIQNLEKVINSLRTQLYGMSRAGPDFMLDKPPPDVY